MFIMGFLRVLSIILMALLLSAGAATLLPELLAEWPCQNTPK
ncbi:MAG TPA: hypothetical protein PKJ15_03890 [Methanomassiliicoccales archaeon]|nr:hypothetical protein [Methanomassiliicoccales archaeon]